MEVFSRFIFVLLLVNIFISQLLALTCYTSRDEYGTCVEIRSCPSMLKFLKMKPVPPEIANYLRESRCPIQGATPSEVFICCPPETSVPKFNPRDLLPENCGQQTADRIVGGEVADIDEFPWMVLLEYQTARGLQTYCSGVLISKRYVLTAAHCLSNKKLSSSTLKNVRLGEYDKTQNPDCIVQPGVYLCADPFVRIPVTEIFVHEEYVPSSRHQRNDIGLLRLERDVQFTNFIQPICLPQSSKLEQLLHTAGWGATEYGTNSDKKLKLSVPLSEIGSCRSKYQLAGAELGFGQFCAGGVKGKDSCRGDSGGPIMAISFGDNDDKPKWVSAGVVSFGPTPCGQEGWPGVYTKTHDFMPWILSKLRQ